jgi:hypothetical protein
MLDGNYSTIRTMRGSVRQLYGCQVHLAADLGKIYNVSRALFHPGPGGLFEAFKLRNLRRLGSICPVCSRMCVFFQSSSVTIRMGQRQLKLDPSWAGINYFWLNT